MADTFTAADFETWMPARQAFELITKHFGTKTATAILSRLASGLIKARAENLFLNYHSKNVDYTFSTPIPTEVWKKLDNSQYPSRISLWTTCDVEVDVYRSGFSSPIAYKLFGVRFEPSDLQKMLPQESALPASTIPSSPAVPPGSPTAAPQPATPNQAGRLRKEFWDDLLIAIFKQLWDGDLKPQSQADIERAMLDWASQHGYELSESSAKAPAKKMFQALKE